MDRCGHDNHVNRMEHFRGFHPQWNMPHYQEKEKNLMMNRKLMDMATERDTAVSERDTAVSERDTAVSERDRSLAEKEAALHELDIACQQRDAAMADREIAIRERDNALAALHFHENITLNPNSHGTKHTHCQHIAPLPSEPLKSKRKKENSAPNKPLKTYTNKKVMTSYGPKAEMSEIRFDQLSVAVPVCTCTGEPHQCYKWGNMGWQSSCCTTTLSVYPLPQVTNKRHSRIGGRKMSGSVFSRLLMRVAEQGLDISSQPLDLKNYWAKHGTNRYITIK